MSKYTITDLKQRQSLPLADKIKMAERRIQEWIDEYGVDGVYVSFSGGKDSTVLADIVRNRMGYKQIPLVFVDVPTQYPELKDFAKTFDNVIILRPKISFMEVCSKYGFPLISKEVSAKAHEAKSKPDGHAARRFQGEKAGTKFDISKWAFLLEADFNIAGNCCHVMKKAPIKKFEKENHKYGMTAQMASESALRSSEWM